MKIAFYVPNGGLRELDFSSPQFGNPGSGAAEYLHIALPFYIDGDGYDCYIYAQDITKLPISIKNVHCESLRDAVIKAKLNNIDIFVFRPRINEEDNILSLIDQLELNCVGRAALTPSILHQKKLAKSNFFKALVSVGSQQYDFLLDSPIEKKLTYIDNGISFSATQVSKVTVKKQKLVTYMGAIVPQKGFHILARVWPKILQFHPDAELRVIGSSKIYNQDYKVGPLGIADNEYEQKFIIPYLCDQNGNLNKSVTFLGPLGAEKYRHLSESMVAVANPSGQTETCCVSAIEMSACATAVVSGAYYALLGTVRHGISGLLGRGDKELINNICYLLSNPSVAVEMGINGKKIARDKYDFSIVIISWRRLFDDIHNRKKIYKPRHELNYIYYHRKWLRLLNYFPATVIRSFVGWPSTQEFENLLLKIMRRFGYFK